MIRVTPHEPHSVLTTGEVADVLGCSRRTILRIPRDQLDYWETHGGEHRKHRRYEAGTVRAYASTYLGLQVGLVDPALGDGVG